MSRAIADQGGQEAAVARAMHRRREPHDAGPYPLGGERQGRLRVGDARVAAQVGQVLLGGDPAGREVEGARGDHQRPVGAHQGRADRVDRRQVRLRGRRHAGEVMVVAEVDHPVGLGRPGPQAVEVVQFAAVYLGAERGDGGGGALRSREAEDLVAGVEQFGDDGGADPAAGSGDEDAHDDLLSRPLDEAAVMSLDDINLAGDVTVRHAPRVGA